MLLPKFIFSKIFIYIPNKYNISLSQSLKEIEEKFKYDINFINFNFYQEENFYYINMNKKIVNNFLKLFNKEMNKLLDNLKLLNV